MNTAEGELTGKVDTRISETFTLERWNEVARRVSREVLARLIAQPDSRLHDYFYACENRGLSRDQIRAGLRRYDVKFGSNFELIVDPAALERDQ